MILTYDNADEQVRAMNGRKGRSFYWDGWTICMFRPNRNAYTNSRAVFRKGRWGFEDRMDVSSDGTWKVPDVPTG